MFESLKNIFKKNKKKEIAKSNSKDAAKERLHLVLMQDRANVSADFLDLMRREIIEVIKKYIDIDEEAMDVRLTTETDEDGAQGAPALYANIPIINIKDEARNLPKTEKENKIKIEPPNTEKIEKENEETATEVIEQQNEDEKPTNENIEKNEQTEEESKEKDSKHNQKDLEKNEQNQDEEKQENKESTEQTEVKPETPEV